MTFLTCEMIIMHGMKGNSLTTIIIMMMMMMTMWWMFLVQ